MSKEIKIKPLEFIRSEAGPKLPLFRAHLHTMRNPRNNYHTKRLVLESPDWVNVVAVTRTGKLLIIYQYRSGADEITAEIPGGIVDEGESSLTAAKRELQEETGYTSQDWRYLGAVQPNPAIHKHLCHHWLALNVAKSTEMALDDGEDIQVECLTIKEVQAEIASGRLRHALVLSGLSRVLFLWPQLLP